MNNFHSFPDRQLDPDEIVHPVEWYARRSNPSPHVARICYNCGRRVTWIMYKESSKCPHCEKGNNDN